METATKKVRMTISLPQREADYLRKKAKSLGWSLSELAGEYILDGIYQTPNPDTLKAIEEARSGKYAGTVDTSSIEAMTKSILG
jgi:hypothetical protein